MGSARIQHIALSVENPAKTAEYLKSVFHMEEINRRPADDGSDGVWLTDGYMYFAVLPPKNAGSPLAGVSGIHHIGFNVDNLEEAVAAFTDAGAVEAYDSSSANRKFMSPDGFCVDLRSADRRFWDKRVGAAGLLLELKPAEEVPELGDEVTDAEDAKTSLGARDTNI